MASGSPLYDDRRRRMTRAECVLIADLRPGDAGPLADARARAIKARAARQDWSSARHT